VVPDAPAAPAQVVLRFSSRPPGALVRVVGAQDLGTTPFTINWPRGQGAITVELVKPGFRTIVHELGVAGDGALDVALTELPPKPVPDANDGKVKPPVVKSLDRGGTMEVFDN
jgi:hypothetical protein